MKSDFKQTITDVVLETASEGLRTIQRQELQAKTWKIANEVRGAVDGWDFKQFVLGTLFYRFISENFTNYMEARHESVNYADLSDDAPILEQIKDDAIKYKGYFIYPSQLFQNIAKTANTNETLNTDLANIFRAIENSANGYDSERDIKGLFADFDTTSNRLGNTVADKNKRLASVIKGVERLDFGIDDSQIDLFGYAYEFLISRYAANAGSAGGKIYTPQNVSKLIVQLSMHKQNSVNKIYDPACGSGSLLLQAKKHFDEYIIEDGFFGQEINHTTYNFARMNMFLHNIDYENFDISLGDTLINPKYGNEKPFDAIVSNLPFYERWIGSDDPTLINDDRFAPAGVLAPNLFYGTENGMDILVLSKNKTKNKTQFINASGEDFFKKGPKKNVLTDEHIAQIIDIIDKKEDVEYVASWVENDKIAENDYNLSVSAYVEAKSTREVIDKSQLNTEITEVVTKINQLRADIDVIVKELEMVKKNRTNDLKLISKKNKN